MTQQEYDQQKRECMREFKREYVNDRVTWEPASPYDIFSYAFDQAYALGRKEKDEDTVIQGWIARDMDGEIYLYENKPKRRSDEWLGILHPEFDFQNVRWSNDPIEVEIIIQRKKK